MKILTNIGCYEKFAIFTKPFVLIASITVIVTLCNVFLSFEF